MNEWFLAAAALMACIVPLFVLVLRGSLLDAVIALQITGVVAVLALLLLTEGVANTSLVDPAVVIAFLTLGSGLVYLHFAERWI